MRRRDLLGASALAFVGMPLLVRVAAAADAAPAFDYAWLKGRARALAAAAYVPPPVRKSPALDSLDWDRYMRLRFRPERALWAADKLRFHVRFFHLGLQYREPVRMHVIDGGRVRDLDYDPSMFDLAGTGLKAADLPPDLGFAGFRIHFHTDFDRDVAAFLGASYFRAVGASLQYGLSARGLAVDSGLNRPEEFPIFREFWFERPAPQSDTLTVYALLDSPSIAGAFRFAITPAPLLAMRVDAALYPRRPIERLGVAPLTSMFLCAPHDRRVADDWRPSIHDSDGLALHNAHGEWLWRPLSNPEVVRFNAFADDASHGFGLMQRDRDFDHYQDDGAWYDRRPSAWIEPLAGFGKGAIDLLELPANNETADNIVAFFQPADAPQPGQELLYAYRMLWGEPPLPPLAHVVATWSGIGGAVGTVRDHFSWRFVVDFSGGTLAQLPAHAKVEAVASATGGATELVSARRLAPVRGYRAMFDVRPGNMREPIELRLFLRLAGRVLSETWIYHWTPPPHVAP